MSMAGKRNAGSVILTALTFVIAAVYVIPLVWSLFVSLKVEGTPIRNAWDWFSPPYSLGSYGNVMFKSDLPTWFLNSVLIAVISTFLTVLFSAMAAFPLAKIKFIGRNKIFFYFLIGLMVPGEATIVPLFITVNGLYMIDTYFGMILPSIAGSMNLIIMVTFFKSIPNDLIEAAHIDGARNGTVFSRILLPLSKTVLITVSIFAFMGSWNNYLWPLLCAMGKSMFTLPVGVPTLMSTYTVDWVIPSTGNMVASIPAIIVFLLFERQITRGIALSGIKG
jgi:multiple sugar transport system permease protein